MSWRPDWRNFGDGNRFQRLVNDLLRAHLAGRGRIVPFELPQDGGFDGIYEGDFHETQGTFRIQATFQAPTPERHKEQLGSLRAKLVEEGSRPKTGETHLLFVTNADLRESEWKELQDAGTQAGIPTMVMPGAEVEGLLRDNPHVAAKYFPDALCAFVDIEAWLAGTGLDLATEPPLAPRLDAFAAELVATIKRQVGSERKSLLLLLLGNPGVGKTRLLERLGRSATEVGKFDVRSWRPGFGPVGAALVREVAVQRGGGDHPPVDPLLIFDDAERLGDDGALFGSLEAIREFAWGAQRHGRPVAVCLATTPSHADAGFATIRRKAKEGFVEKQLPTIPLAERAALLSSLGVSGQMAVGVATTAGEDLRLADRMARAWKATGTIPSVAEVLAGERHHGAMALGQQLGMGLPRVEHFLGVVAAFEPVSGQPGPIADVVAREVGETGASVVKLLDHAEQVGVLRQTRVGYRFRVPLQATAFLHELLRGGGTAEEALVERLLSVPGAESRVATNLAGVIAFSDAGRLPDVVGRIMDAWVQRMRGLGVRDRMRLLDSVRIMGPYVPERALAAIDACIASEPPPPASSDPLEQLVPERPDFQLGPLAELAGVLLRAQDFAARALRALRAITERGWHSQTGANPCATRAAEDLAYERASTANIAAASTELADWMKDGRLPADSTEIVRRVALAWLSSTWRSQYFDGEKLHMTEGPLPDDSFIIEVRQRALGLLAELAGHTDPRVRRETWKSLGWYGQPGWYRGPLAPQIVSAIRAEALRLVRLATGRWPLEADRWDVLAELERFLLRTMADEDVPELLAEVRRTLAALPRPPHYRAYRLLVDREWYVEDLGRLADPSLKWPEVVDRLHEDMAHGFDRSARRLLAEALAAEVVDPAGLLRFLRDVDARAPGQGGWGYGDLLVALLGDVRPAWWTAVAGAEGSGSALPPRFQRLLRALQSQLDLAGLKAAAASVIADPGAMREDEVVRIVEALWKSPELPDVGALLERLAEHPSVAVREAVVQAILLSGYRKSSPVGAASALRRALMEPVTLELLDRSSQGVGDPRYGIPANEELPRLRATLLDRVVSWPKLDLHRAYWLRKFIGRVCEESVDEFLSILGRRLEQAPPADSEQGAAWRFAWIPEDLFDPRLDPAIPPLGAAPTHRVQEWLVDRWLSETRAGHRAAVWRIETALTDVAGGSRERPGPRTPVAVDLARSWVKAGDLDRAAVLLRAMTATADTIQVGIEFLVAAGTRDRAGRQPASTFHDLVRIKHTVTRAMHQPSTQASTRLKLLQDAVEDARAKDLPVDCQGVLGAALVEVQRGIEEDRRDDGET